jgi:lipopolysaccharide transport system ATP-binding protein
MPNIAIKVDGIGKQYRMGEREQYKAMRDVLMDVLHSPWSALRRRNGAENAFWALWDVSFEIKPGEAIGLIGRNGAGKSTLLKVLSRITEPSLGRAYIYGRVGSLLEVGSGFHPELTGRENIFLNGAILGMKRTEIERRFDEIVEFAGVEKFLDTPLKRYSSGMHMRLAFAVAAHLEPEILLVDEVLAVGDVAFQKKCVGKMGEVASHGRTVLFVSHNMAVVQALCSRGLVIANGKLCYDGAISDAINHYLRELELVSSTTDLAARTDRRGRGKVRLSEVSVTSDSVQQAMLTTGGKAEFTFVLSGECAKAECLFTIFDHLGTPLLSFKSSSSGPRDSTDLGNLHSFRCEIDELPLLAGRYVVAVRINGDGELQDAIGGACYFDVEHGILGGRPMAPNNGFTHLCVDHRWILPAFS